MKKICPVCNNEFETNIPNKICCSSYCNNKRKTSKSKDKEYKNTCQCCGKEFISKSSGVKYCSDECRDIKLNEFNNRVYKKYCKYCNTYFETKNNSQVYCSDECREYYYKEYQKLNKNENKKKNNINKKAKKKKVKKKNKKKYKKICKFCGKEFLTISNGKLYCSKKCKNLNKNKLKIVTCKFCGKEFSTISNKKYCSDKCRDTKQKVCPICGEKFYASRDTIYCSKECRKIGIKYKKDNKNKMSQTELDLSKNNDSIRLMFNGKPINTWHIPGFTEQLKSEILDRDKHKCYICGKETNLHIHHIIPREQGGPHIPENLITLCGSCHRSVESGNVEKIIKKCIKALEKGA